MLKIEILIIFIIVSQVFEELQGQVWYQIKGQSIWYWNMCGVAHPKMGPIRSFGGFDEKMDKMTAGLHMG